MWPTLEQLLQNAYFQFSANISQAFSIYSLTLRSMSVQYWNVNILVFDTLPILVSGTWAILVSDTRPILVCDNLPILISDTRSILVSDTLPILVSDTPPILVSYTQPIFVFDTREILVSDIVKHFQSTCFLYRILKFKFKKKLRLYSLISYFNIFL